MIMRLRYIEQTSFQPNELTQVNKLMQKTKNDPINLGKDDCVLFVSKSMKILRFVFGFTNQKVVSRMHPDGNGVTKVLSTRVVRIDGGGTWNPLMLRDYAEKVGIELAGLKRYEDYCKELGLG